MSNIKDIKSVHHEFQIIPLDFLYSPSGDPEELNIPDDIREQCGYDWLTPDTISLKGEMGVMLNLAKTSQGGWTNGDYGVIAFGEGVSTWFDIVNYQYTPCAECIISNSDIVDINNKIPNTKLRFLINLRLLRK